MSQTVHYYYDQLEQHLPFKPSKWERKYKILLVGLGVLLLIMGLVAFALHDKVCFIPIVVLVGAEWFLDCECFSSVCSKSS